MTDLDLVRLQLGAMFVLDGGGDIVCENDPPRSVAPEAVVVGCADGNVCLFRGDVEARCRREVQALLTAEPPLSGFASRLVHQQRYAEIFSAAEASYGLNWVLNGARYPGDAQSAVEFVSSDSADGRALLERFAREGVPQALVDLGFVDAGEFWAPWCALLSGGEIAALAFAARLGEAAADLGLITVPAFRRRGYGAAVTAAWAALPALAGRALFYSTTVANLSSQRVVERLGLRFIGASCRIG